MTTDYDYERARLSRAWFLIPAFLCLILVFAVRPVLGAIRAEVLAFSVAAIGIVVIATHAFWQTRWFRIWLVAIILAHALAIFLLPWPERHALAKPDAIFIGIDVLFLVGTLVIANPKLLPKR